MQLEDWLDDLCVRFIVNLPPEELSSVERICFQVEEAQWFYEDFIRPLDPALPSLSLRAFSLRIFQHCPLFSQWSAQHHTTAFAEFLAYKSRVPVRGAIMLNEAMDEVVLVKGWKKGANWSFPRGKINKDENDLDCAVREVYEETGLDIRAAGLVKEEKEMKYIEVTMREQHMKLYVFRGVPKDTHFEPRTRKEISKIEWYKLTDLPTLKKHKHQDSVDSGANAINANKFYMVAPFLTPLKKWIAQQRKKEHRQSSKLGIPSVVAEEFYVASENDADGPLYDTVQPISDLPEVSKATTQDVSSHLKALLHIGEHSDPLASSLPATSLNIAPVVANIDSTKSNALLALLRGDRVAEISPRTLLEQATSTPQLPESAQHSHARQTTSSTAAPPPLLEARGELSAGSSVPHPIQHPSAPLQPRNWAEVAKANIPQTAQSQDRQADIGRSKPGFAVAPYQQTDDPQLYNRGSAEAQRTMIPSASALPKLTNHTKSLLDMLRGGEPVSAAKQSLPNPTEQSILNLFTNMHSIPQQSALDQRIIDPTQQSQSQDVGVIMQHQTRQHPYPSTASGQHDQSTSIPHQKTDAQNSLLELFARKNGPASIPAQTQFGPVELAATALQAPDRQNGGSSDDLPTTLLKAPHDQFRNKRSTGTSNMRMPKEGETSATVDGPLNQPDFEILRNSAKHVNSEFSRSPVVRNKTLYDPNQGTPVKILNRPGSAGQAAKSPRIGKGGERASSNKRSAKEVKESSKPFQPQILRRPQPSTAASADNDVQDSGPVEATSKSADMSVPSGRRDSPLPPHESMPPPPMPPSTVMAKRSSQAEGHKENLLALFGKPNLVNTNTKVESGGTSPRVVSPLSTSQILSPHQDGAISLPGIGPISTRSRVGSMTSVGGGSSGIQPGLERRQTGAENKTFLLGYLGRIASQTS